MADTPERDVRDRLAEALWRREIALRGGMVRKPWSKLANAAAEAWLYEADRLLAILALPSVGLTISTDPQDDGGRG